jgi:hypothetical protein
MTIQELIDELQRSVDELGFDSNATVNKRAYNH